MPLAAYITFRLGAEHFALPVTHVREVLDQEEITPLPLAPEALLGVVNVRDSAVPVIDLRRRFGLPATAPGRQARILVMEFALAEGTCVLGGLADAVQEVIELDSSEIRPAPGAGSPWKAGLVEGITLREGHFILLLHTETLFSSDELRTLGAHAREGAP